jgi:hypothetical protein
MSTTRCLWTSPTLRASTVFVTATLCSVWTPGLSFAGRGENGTRGIPVNGTVAEGPSVAGDVEGVNRRGRSVRIIKSVPPGDDEGLGGFRFDNNSVSQPAARHTGGAIATGDQDGVAGRELQAWLALIWIYLAPRP